MAVYCVPLVLPLAASLVGEGGVRVALENCVPASLGDAISGQGVRFQEAGGWCVALRRAREPLAVEDRGVQTVVD